MLGFFRLLKKANDRPEYNVQNYIKVPPEAFDTIRVEIIIRHVNYVF